MKTWLTASEWTQHINCSSDGRHVTPPENMSEGDVQAVIKACYGCRVRAECIQEAVKYESTGIWCASEWIPEVKITDTPKKAALSLQAAAEVRMALSKTVEDELARRGEF